MFEGVYKGTKVLVTGHTGFKGSWLTFWLERLGARVAGFSVDVPTTPSHYRILGLADRIADECGDIRDRAQLEAVMRRFQPQIVFHLAAQALVRRSFDDPVYTVETNTLGTLNVLECIRTTPSVRVAVMITSDKCYRNLEWTWGYRENDVLGGDDPYSASKGCAELLIRAYCRSFFKEGRPAIASTRAGNVIGGGDWAADRIVPDAVRAWSQGQPVVVRNPQATRPWQHVLEPLSGYLWLASRLHARVPGCHAEAFNFGPEAVVNQPVAELLEQMTGHWPGARMVVADGAPAVSEATLLKLCCDKSLNVLRWRPVLSFDETVRMTATWYRRYYDAPQGDMAAITASQIDHYVGCAEAKGLPWTR